MPPIGRPLDQVTEADIIELRDNSVPEDRYLDYKRDAIGGSDADRKEFLKDVSAFANVAGGDLVIGVADENGVPTDLVGLPDLASLDQEVQRLDAMIRTGIEPRIIGYHVWPIERGGGPPFIVVRVPRSWNPPHRVTFAGWNKFFVRNSNGAHEANVEELRAMFLAAATAEERVRSFRQERAAIITRDRTPVLLEPGAKLVLHVVALSIASANLDLEKAYSLGDQFRPVCSGGFNRRINFDGLLTYAAPSEGGRSFTYAQLFRDGRLETARGSLLMDLRPRRPLERVLPWADIDKDVFDVLPSYLRGLATLGAEPPYAVLLSLLGVRDSVLLQDRWSPSAPTDRDDLLIDPVIIDTAVLEGEWHQRMRPALDAMWNAYGYVRAAGFNNEGKWAPTRA